MSHISQTTIQPDSQPTSQPISQPTPVPSSAPAHPTDEAGPALTAGRRKAILAVVALALMMVVSAVSGLNVALPDLAVDTGASQTQITWIVDAYTLVFAGLLLPAGAIGDRFGRRGVLLFGLIAFGSAAAAAMFVSSPEVLIALRTVMGLGAACVMPVTLSIITTSFPPEERGKAVGVWVGVAGGGAVIGLFGSGLLLEFFAWNSFFALNVTLAVMAIIGTLIVIPTSRDAHPPRLDPVGALFSLGAVAAVIFAVIEGPDHGWGSARTIGAFALSALCAVAFVLWELRNPEPMLDPRLFRLRGFSTGTLAITVQFFASFGMFYIVLQYLQYIDDRSPLEAAFSLLPLPLVLIPLARNAPRIADRFGNNRVVGLGLLFSAGGMLVMTTLTTDLVYWHLAVGLMLFAAGMGLAGTPSTSAITSSLPPEKQGVGSAVNDTSRELGSALGIAILGTILNSSYQSGIDDAQLSLPSRVTEAARSSIAFVHAGSDQLDRIGPSGHQLVTTAQQSFVDASGTAFGVAAVILVVASIYTFWRGPKEAHVKDAETQVVSSSDEPAEQPALTGGSRLSC